MEKQLYFNLFIFWFKIEKIGTNPLLPNWINPIWSNSKIYFGTMTLLSLWSLSPWSCLRLLVIFYLRQQAARKSFHHISHISPPWHKAGGEKIFVISHRSDMLPFTQRTTQTQERDQSSWIKSTRSLVWLSAVHVASTTKYCINVTWKSICVHFKQINQHKCAPLLSPNTMNS